MINIDKLEISMREGRLPTYREIRTAKDVSPYDYILTGPNYYKIRREYNEKYSWPIITKELVDEISQLIKDKIVIDVGSGLGWLSHHLKQANPELDLTTIDDDSHNKPNLHRPVDIVVDYATHQFDRYNVAIISWPSYNASEINEVLKRLPQGCMIIYCGEDVGGMHW